MMVYSNIILAELDLEQYRGDSSNYILIFYEDEELTTPLDLTKFLGSLKMQIKEHPDAIRVLDTLTEGSGLTVGTTTNELTISSAGINNLNPAKSYVYDIEGVDTFGIRATIIRGKVILVADVTR